MKRLVFREGATERAFPEGGVQREGMAYLARYHATLSDQSHHHQDPALPTLRNADLRREAPLVTKNY